MNITMAHQIAGMLRSNHDPDELPICASLIFEHMTENQQFKWITKLQLDKNLSERLLASWL